MLLINLISSLSSNGIFTINFWRTADSLVNELENASEVQQRIIIDDIEKLEEFSLNNKKIEILLFYKTQRWKNITKKI